MENTKSNALSVRFRHRSLASAYNDISHEMRKGPQPKYVVGALSHLNSVIVKPASPALLRDICAERRKLNEMSRVAKASASVSSSFIITFGKGLQPYVEALSHTAQNALYTAVAEAVTAHLGIEMTGLVAHRDETAPHAHGQAPARHPDGRPMGKVITPKIASEIQDIAMAAAAPFLPTIERGKKKQDRIDDGDDLKSIYNRSVRRLHDDLPLEIAAAEAELVRIKERLAKNERLTEKALADRLKIEAHDQDRIAQVEKRLATYEHRVTTASADCAAAAAQLEALRQQMVHQEDAGEEIIANARAIAAGIVSDADAEVAVMKAQAAAGIEDEKTAARAEGFDAGYAEAKEEVLALRAEVSKLQQWLEDTVAKFGSLFARMRGVVRDARIDLNNRDIAKSALAESPGFETEFNKIRKALKRVGEAVQVGGIASRLAREQDAKTLAPFRAEQARRDRMEQSPPPADDDPDSTVRADL